ncbi:hypothetical protein D3C74_389870 [compost metagenome]
MNASITPVLTGSGRAWTAAGVRLDASPPPVAAPPGMTSARLADSRVVKIVLKSAVPTAAPISRKKLFALVAVPISWGSTEFWTASTMVCMTSPMPAPITKIMAPNRTMDMSPVIVVSQMMPAVVIARPTTG